MGEGACRPLADDEVRFDARAVEHLEYADAEDGSGSAGDTDNEASGLRLFHAETFSTKPQRSTRDTKISTEERERLEWESLKELLRVFHAVKVENYWL